MRPLAQDVLDVLHHHGGNLLGVVVRLEPVGAGDVVPGAGGGRRGVEVALAVDVAAGLSLGAVGSKVPPWGAEMIMLKFPGTYF